MQANQELKQRMRYWGVSMFQLGKALNKSENTMIRRLRVPLSKKTTDEYLAIVEKLGRGIMNG